MAYPTITPSSRNFDAGQYPVKTYSAINGKEVRILYGDKRTGMTLDLSYDNVTDANADDFISHYDETKGTFTAFDIPSAAKTGWTGATTAIDAATGNRWRYAEPPRITSVRPGISSVTVKLVGVL